LLIFPMSLTCTSLSSMPIICRFGLLMEWQSSWVLFASIYYFFLYIHLIFLLYLLCLKSLILSYTWFSLLDQLSTEFFIWVKELFISRALFIFRLSLYWILTWYLALCSLFLSSFIYLFVFPLISSSCLFAFSLCSVVCILFEFI
jgi:hypothetical protein